MEDRRIGATNEYDSSDGFLRMATMTSDDILLYLHGHGSNATEAADRAERIDPDRRFRHATIDAPIDLGDGRGRSWFDTGSSGIDAASLDTAAGHVVAVLAALRNESPEARIVLAGFSQGASVALAAAARDAAGVQALVLHCGFHPDPVDDLSEIEGLPVLVCRAADDDVVPDFFADALVDQLAAVGAKVDQHDLPGGHEFSDPMAEATKGFLDQHVGVH